MHQYIRITLLLVLLSIGYQSTACDVCGCSFGGNYYGVLPQFSKHFAGVRYQHRSFVSNGLSNEGLPVQAQDVFRRIELWGRFYPHKRLQIFGFVPYVLNQQKSEGKSLNVNGLGDVMLNVNYTLINTGDSTDVKYRQLLLIGAGTKAPTGSFKSVVNGEQLHANMQIGSGSWDYLANMIYNIRYKSVGLSTDLTYKYNTSNADDYRFGDRVNSAMNLFYWDKFWGLTVMPLGGMYYEFAYVDVSKGFKQKATGGEALFGNVGLDLYWKKMSLGILCQMPIVQDNPSIKANNRFMTTFNYMF
jgi:hypothetical protein